MHYSLRHTALLESQKATVLCYQAWCCGRSITSPFVVVPRNFVRIRNVHDWKCERAKGYKAIGIQRPELCRTGRVFEEDAMSESISAVVMGVILNVPASNIRLVLDASLRQPQNDHINQAVDFCNRVS